MASAFARENTKDVAKSIREAFDNGGIEAVNRHVAEVQNGWKKVTVNVGVIGKVGVGKSTFINAYRNIRYDDEDGAAPVNVDQETMIATPYPDPENDHIVLYDVPGVGTEEFTKSSYLSNPNVDIDNYDIIILITSTRFTETDYWLYTEMKQRNKPVFFVRTKVMQDVENERKGKREQAKKQKHKVIEEVIKKYKSSLKLDAKVYFIDSYDRDNPDLQFEELLDDIVNDIPKNKREALLFSLRIYTPKLIRKKVELLQKRKWFLGIISGAVGAIPVPEITNQIDQALFDSEGQFYRKQLGLETWRNSKIYGINAETKKAINYLTDKWKLLSVEMIAASLTSTSIQSVRDVALPVIGSITTAITSYCATVYALKQLLDEMAEDAIEINGKICESLRNTTDNDN